MASKSWIVGTPEQARDALLAMQEELWLRGAPDLPPPARHAPGGDTRTAPAASGPTCAPRSRRAYRGQPVAAGVCQDAAMLKDLPQTIGTGLHGSIPPRRYWAYYTWQEIDAHRASGDPNATAVINVGAVEQHGPHLPLITDTLVGMELLGAALARLPDDVTVLALPPTNFGKSTEHQTFLGR